MVAGDPIYSVVDTASFTDTGPEIQLVDESSGKKAPLSKLEKVAAEKRGSPQPSSTKSPSILDTVRGCGRCLRSWCERTPPLQIMAIVGDDISSQLESDEDSSSPDLPPPPTQTTHTTDKEAIKVSDEVPPAVPVRTHASTELLDDAPPPLPVAPPPSRGHLIKKSSSSEGITNMAGIYETPTDCECTCIVHTMYIYIYIV